jgi:hypothetical protein
MISASSVKAEVVDIRGNTASFPRTVVADANVLYFIYYDFASLAAAGAAVPPHRQRQPYHKWWTQALNCQVTLCSTGSAFSEFVHLVERMELQSEWITDPHRPELDPDNPGQPFSPKYVKNLRYHYRDRLPAIRANAETYLASARKTVELLPEITKGVDTFNATIRAWCSSTADIRDAELVTEAKRAGVSHIVSDDADFVSFDGIRLYSANSAAVAAASESKKLVH